MYGGKAPSGPCEQVCLRYNLAPEGPARMSEDVEKSGASVEVEAVLLSG